MFNSQILQKDKPQTILLLHGLYASAGFWLPILRCLPRHRLILLNINYDLFFASKNGFADLSEYLRRPSLNLTDCISIIGHSLGCVLAALLELQVARRFHLAPVFLAEDADLIGLQVEISKRLGSFTSPPNVNHSQLSHALRVAKSVDVEAITERGDCLLIPDSDRFFFYRTPPVGANWSTYSGGHFDVSAALVNTLNL